MTLDLIPFLTKLAAWTNGAEKVVTDKKKKKKETPEKLMQKCVNKGREKVC